MQKVQNLSQPLIMFTKALGPGFWGRSPGISGMEYIFSESNPVHTNDFSDSRARLTAFPMPSI